MAKDDYSFSLLTDDLEHCYLCGREAIHRHHVMHGRNRKQATADHLWLPLCLECHAKAHNDGKLDYTLKRMAQQVFEARYGHDEWLKKYGKNY